MSELPPRIDDEGNSFWRYDNKYHRDNGPAIIYNDGSFEWWWMGVFHRDNGPAVVDVYGNMEWYRNGERHRDDGPAIVRADGSREWFRNGEPIITVLCSVHTQKIILSHLLFDLSPYPSCQHIRGGIYLDDTDLALFLLTHTVVEMPYE